MTELTHRPAITIYEKLQGLASGNVVEGVLEICREIPKLSLNGSVEDFEKLWNWLVSEPKRINVDLASHTAVRNAIQHVLGEKARMARESCDGSPIPIDRAATLRAARKRHVEERKFYARREGVQRK